MRGMQIARKERKRRRRKRRQFFGRLDMRRDPVVVYSGCGCYAVRSWSCISEEKKICRGRGGAATAGAAHSPPPQARGLLSGGNRGRALAYRAIGRVLSRSFLQGYLGGIRFFKKKETLWPLQLHTDKLLQYS